MAIIRFQFTLAILVDRMPCRGMNDHPERSWTMRDDSRREGAANSDTAEGSSGTVSQSVLETGRESVRNQPWVFGTHWIRRFIDHLSRRGLIVRIACDVDMTDHDIARNVVRNRDPATTKADRRRACVPAAASGPRIALNPVSSTDTRLVVVGQSERRRASNKCRCEVCSSVEWADFHAPVVPDRVRSRVSRARTESKRRVLRSKFG